MFRKLRIFGEHVQKELEMYVTRDCKLCLFLRYVRSGGVAFSTKNYPKNVSTVYLTLKRKRGGWGNGEAKSKLVDKTN